MAKKKSKQNKSRAAPVESVESAENVDSPQEGRYAHGPRSQSNSSS